MKKQSSEMPIVQQKQFPSGNPDLGMTNAIPRDTTDDLTKCLTSWNKYSNDGDFDFKVSKKEGKG